MKYLTGSLPDTLPEKKIRVDSITSPGDTLSCISRVSIGKFREKFIGESHSLDAAARLETALWVCQRTKKVAEHSRQKLNRKIADKAEEKKEIEQKIMRNKDEIGHCVKIIRDCSGTIVAVCGNAEGVNPKINELRKTCNDLMADARIFECKVQEEINYMIYDLEQTAVITKTIALVSNTSPTSAAGLLAECVGALGVLSTNYSSLAAYSSGLKQKLPQDKISSLTAESEALEMIVGAGTLEIDWKQARGEEVSENHQMLSEMAEKMAEKIEMKMPALEDGLKKVRKTITEASKAIKKNALVDKAKASQTLLNSAKLTASTVCKMIRQVPTDHNNIANAILGYAEAISRLKEALEESKRLAKEAELIETGVGICNEREEISKTINELAKLEQRIMGELGAAKEILRKKAEKQRSHQQTRCTRARWEEMLLEREIENLPKFVKPKKQMVQVPADDRRNQKMKKFIGKAQALFKDELNEKNGLAQPFKNRLKELALLYLDNNGKLTRKIIQDRYNVLTHHQRVIGKNGSDFDLVRLSLGRNSGKRMIIDCKSPNSPLIIFVGNKESAMKFMKRVNEGDIALIKQKALEKGMDGLFMTLQSE